MPDLGESIRGYIDGSASAIELDEVQRATVADARNDRGPARALAVAASILVVVIVAGVITMSRDRSNDVTAGPGTTASGVAGSTEQRLTQTPWPWPWRVAREADVPPPPVPAGWKALDVGDFRFAVPADWAVPISRSCAVSSPGIVVVSNGPGDATCSPEPPLPASVLRIETTVDDGATGETVPVGQLWAMRVDGPSCADCTTAYRFDGGMQVSVSGPEADSILATFSWSGARRVLLAGSDTDTSDWRMVEYDGLAFRVPASWGTVDLVSSSHTRTRPDGAVETSGIMDPGMCGSALFPDPQVGRVVLGTSALVPKCPLTSDLHLEPADGIWIRPAPSYVLDVLHDGLGHGPVDDLDVTIVGEGRSRGPVLDLVIRHGSNTLLLSVGVGLDVAIARAIVRSLRAA